jgi:SAM-dependent methyltransferase
MTMEAEADERCSVCGTSWSMFGEVGGRAKARCPTCFGVERNRALADHLIATGEARKLKGKRVLIIRAAHADKVMFHRLTGEKAQTLDMMPRGNPDIVADLVGGTKLPDGEFDVILSVGVLATVADVDAALAEMKRILAPGGTIYFSEPAAVGVPSREYDDRETRASWYGEEFLDKYGVGRYRAFGSQDLERALYRHFDFERVDAVDRATGAAARYYVARKAGDEELAARRAPRPKTNFACTMCGHRFDEPEHGDRCPACKAVARTRSLPTFVDLYLKDRLDRRVAASKPLMAFAMVAEEARVLSPLFGKFTSVSLYGTYGPYGDAPGHTAGIDVRDLSAFASDAYSGVFSIGLFDFFVEHEKALADCFRVIAPGGHFFIQILNSRVKDNDDPPVMVHLIKPTKSYYNYVPDGVTIPSVAVGAHWFTAAMRRTGFLDAQYILLTDEASGVQCHWFIGQKPKAERRKTVAKAKAKPKTAIHKAKTGARKKAKVKAKKARRK